MLGRSLPPGDPGLTPVERSMDLAAPRRPRRLRRLVDPQGARRALPRGGEPPGALRAALPAVEINSSFYRPHRPSTYARWAAETPEGFPFAVKLPKEITHKRRLVDVAEPLDRFLAETAALGPKRGPLLVQLPPSLRLRCRGRRRVPRRAAPPIRRARGLRAPARELVRARGLERLATRRSPASRPTPPWCRRPPSPAGGAGWCTTGCTGRRRSTIRRTPPSTSRPWRDTPRGGDPARPGASSTTRRWGRDGGCARRLGSAR